MKQDEVGLRERFRKDSLENNICWLESFGSRIRRYDGLICVDHPRSTDYCARLIVAPVGDTISLLKTVLAEDARAGTDPWVYVDDEVLDARLQLLLAANGLIRAGVNITKAGMWTPIEESKIGFRLEAAQLEDMDRWSACYSEGFARTGQEVAIDRSRWQLSFEGGRVQHWFLTRQGRTAGVCQTCTASGIVGVFSLTLLPAERGASGVRRAFRALRTRFTSHGSVRVYFERRWNEYPRRHQRLSGRSRGFRIVRRMVGHRHSRDSAILAGSEKASSTQFS